jgi:tRNA(fMet)-specific endonuclease VapC
VKASDVPPGPLLVDTDVFSWVSTGSGRAPDFLPLLRGHVLAVSFVTVAEARKGALAANWGAPKRAALEAALRNYLVVQADDRVCSAWADLAAGLTSTPLKGEGVNDMWIAACALAQNPPMPVATGNLSDFGKIAAKFPLVVVHPDR